jgi:photosystem II stability/assembly factor-like uncharacterized protein
MRPATLLLPLLLLVAPASAQLQPEARSLAVSGNTLYVGTSAGTIFSSVNGGKTWQGFTKFRDDYVIDRMLVDGDHFYVATWKLGDPSSGAFFASADMGKTWKLTLYKPVRGIGVSGSTLVIGALDGVYRSDDYGLTFFPISKDIKDVQSIAIDPTHPSYIFVGTWHLGYYTGNGGGTWHSISKGIINDSDFFALVLDPDGTIFVGACSGIYKGNEDGEQFKKEKTTTDARRTKVIRQVDGSLLYAGTTDGVWATADGGRTWKRRGSRYITVNDMLATSPQHLVVATLHQGVIWSDDGGKTYTESQF